jgi:hypothetical protein
LESLKGKGHSEDLEVDGRILKCIMDLGEVGLEGVDCIHLAQDRYLWRHLMNTAVNRKGGEFLD